MEQSKRYSSWNVMIRTCDIELYVTKIVMCYVLKEGIEQEEFEMND